MIKTSQPEYQAKSALEHGAAMVYTPGHVDI